jgi:hypothetical protein
VAPTKSHALQAVAFCKSHALQKVHPNACLENKFSISQISLTLLLSENFVACSYLKSSANPEAIKHASSVDKSGRHVFRFENFVHPGNAFRTMKLLHRQHAVTQESREEVRDVASTVLDEEEFLSMEEPEMTLAVEMEVPITPEAFLEVGCGSRVLGPGSWVLGPGCRVSGVGFRISGDWGLGFGFRVSGFGFRVLGFRSWVSDFGFWVLGFGFWVLGFGYWGLYIESWLGSKTFDVRAGG